MKQGRVGKVIRVIILLSWLTALVLLIKKSYLSPSFSLRKPEQITPGEMRAEFEPSEEVWLGVYLRGTKIGYVSHLVQKTANGFQFWENSSLRLNLRGEKKKVQLNISCKADKALKLLSFDFNLETDFFALQGKGRIEGRKLLLKISSPGETSKEIGFSLSAEPFLWLNLAPVLIKRGLVPGKSYKASIFDPFTLTNNETIIEVMAREKIMLGGKEEEAVKIRAKFRGIEVYSWLNEKGILKEESPLGFTLLKENKEEVMETGQREIDLFTSLAVPVNQEIKNPRRLTLLKLRLQGIKDLEDFALDGGRQKLKGNLLEIKKETLVQTGGRSRPKISPSPRPGKEKSFQKDSEKYLFPEPLIQSDSPEIKEQLNRIIAAEKNPKKIIVLVLEWINKNIRKESLISIPNALDVLKIGRGDCNEHAVLFAALSRAAGIPAKLVTGIVYSQDAFYYHAWNEVYLNSSWISVDPLFNQFPVDATHVRFLEGGLEDQMNLFKLIGKLKIEIIDLTT